MVYDHNFNYQIAVIFAILIGGVILFVGAILAIYYVCVQNMRADGGGGEKKERLTGSRSSPSPWSAPSGYRPAQPVPASPASYQPPLTGSYQPPTPTHSFPQSQTPFQPFSHQPPPQSYEEAYNQSRMLTPQAGQPTPPQPLLSAQNFEPNRPPVTYEEARSANIPVQQRSAFHTSSV